MCDLPSGYSSYCVIVKNDPSCQHPDRNGLLLLGCPNYMLSVTDSISVVNHGVLHQLFTGIVPLRKYNRGPICSKVFGKTGNIS